MILGILGLLAVAVIATLLYLRHVTRVDILPRPQPDGRADRHRDFRA